MKDVLVKVPLLLESKLILTKLGQYHKLLKKKLRMT